MILWTIVAMAWIITIVGIDTYRLEEEIKYYGEGWDPDQYSIKVS